MAAEKVEALAALSEVHYPRLLRVQLQPQIGARTALAFSRAASASARVRHSAT